jgi:molybdate transport system substrate-binding protein
MGYEDVLRISLTIILLSTVWFALGCDRKESTALPPATGPAPAQELDVAAAADLKFALDQAADQYRHDHPAVHVRITYGSSGNFYEQLRNRALFDLFFSADKSYPDKLIDAGLANKSTEFIYAIGRLVLWAPNDSKIKLSIEALANDPPHRIAIANPAHAPYGRAAEAVLKKYNLWETVQPRLVIGENIGQTAQFVQSGAADVGFVALALALSPTMKASGHYYLIPLDAYPALEQAGVILSDAKHAQAAEQFRQFIVGPQGSALLKQFGFEVPAK